MLETNRTIIRKFTLDDIEKVFFMSQEESLKTWIPNQVYDNLDEAKEVIEYLISNYKSLPTNEEALYVLGIELKETGELIGHVGLSSIDEGIEIGYAIEEKHQGKGLAKEVVTCVSKWAIDELKLDTVYGCVLKNNIASIKVLEGAGYIYIKSNETRNIYTF